MAKRVCSEPGCPTLVDAGVRDGRCDQHRRARDRARGTSGERGYDYRHQQEKAKRLPSAYGTVCPHCGRVMTRDQDLTLDHTVDRTGYVGIVHASCDYSDAAKRGNTQRGTSQDA
jgi:hypothetical protein